MSLAGVPVLAGFASTVIFAGSTLPMLAKAVRTRDLASYSLGNLLMANLGNAVHSVYVVSLPLGPVWMLHGFNEAVTAFMLVWFLRHEGMRARRRPAEVAYGASRERGGADRRRSVRRGRRSSLAGDGPRDPGVAT